MAASDRETISISPRLLIGIALIAIWWPIAWLQLRPISDYYFFPLWLGYILTVDGLVGLRTGTSPWLRSRRLFLGMFVLSTPFWWLFEGLNVFLENWTYILAPGTGTIEYILLSTLSFSVVIPAVFCTVELIASFRVGERLPGLGQWQFSERGLRLFQVTGVIMLILIALTPRYTFPLVWLALFFIIEPINYRLGQNSLSNYTHHGNWAPVWNVWIGTTLTGFFWEMWNVQALPKWEYNVPFVDVWRVFEMPILGYFGYMPFGLEVIAFTALTLWLVGERPQRYLRLSRNQEGQIDRHPARQL
jgi:hypothetical protein